MRAFLSVAVLVGAVSAASSVYFASLSHLEWILDSENGQRVVGRDPVLPQCDTYINSQQCGVSNFIFCLKGLTPGNCLGDCSGYQCSGQNNVMYCWAKQTVQLNALDCTYINVNCGSQIVMPPGSACQVVFNGVPPVPVGCTCTGNPVVTNNPCTDQTLNTSTPCSPTVIAFYKPSVPDAHWLAALRARSEAFHATGG